MRMLRYATPVLMLSTSLMAAEMPKVGALFRGELNMNNQKTMESSVTKSGSLSTFGQMAFLDGTLNGSLSDNVKFESQVAFINGGAGAAFCQKSAVKKANATWSNGAIFSATIGCSKDRVGGWDFANYEEAATIRPLSPVMTYGPNASAYNPAIDLTLHMLGDLTLRIQDDVLAAAPSKNWNTRVQQTWGLEWKGDIAGFKPILQYASFDDGHSWTGDIGVQLSIAGVGVTADYMTLALSRKTPVVGGKNESKIDSANRISLELNYTIPNMVTPYLYFSNYKMKANAADPGANSALATWDHEGQVISIGAFANGVSPNYMPYLAIDMQGGKFFDKTNNEKPSKTDTIIRLGATAHF